MRFAVFCLLVPLLSISLFASLGWAQSDTVKTSASYNIAKIDPTDAEYPGGRGTDEMVVYTMEYPRTTTGTNEWGIEAVVQDSVIVSVGGNNSPIN